MPALPALRVTFAADSGEPTPVLLDSLSPSEQNLVLRLPTERQRRQSATARIAGRWAVRRSLGPPRRTSTVEILKASNGQPFVSTDGDVGSVSISLAHSSRLAVAFAWTNHRGGGYSAGVDLERVRHSDVATSSYAFSRGERKLISEASSNLSWSGLAAWTAKEAAWKALRPGMDCGPDTIELCEFDLRQGRAALRPRGKLRRCFGETQIRTRLVDVLGPDGSYILSLAELDSRAYTRWHYESL
jgi:4'-phosphopantetheinyl transferase EntD